MVLSETTYERAETDTREVFSEVVSLCEQVVLPLALAHRPTLNWAGIFEALMQVQGSQIEWLAQQRGQDPKIVVQHLLEIAMSNYSWEQLGAARQLQERDVALVTDHLGHANALNHPLASAIFVGAYEHYIPRSITWGSVGEILFGVDRCDRQVGLDGDQSVFSEPVCAYVTSRWGSKYYVEVDPHTGQLLSVRELGVDGSELHVSVFQDGRSRIVEEHTSEDVDDLAVVRLFGRARSAVVPLQRRVQDVFFNYASGPTMQMVYGLLAAQYAQAGDFFNDQVVDEQALAAQRALDAQSELSMDLIEPFLLQRVLIEALQIAPTRIEQLKSKTPEHHTKSLEGVPYSAVEWKIWGGINDEWGPRVVVAVPDLLENLKLVHSLEGSDLGVGVVDQLSHMRLQFVRGVNSVEVDLVIDAICGRIRFIRMTNPEGVGTMLELIFDSAQQHLLLQSLDKGLMPLRGQQKIPYDRVSKGLVRQIVEAIRKCGLAIDDGI